MTGDEIKIIESHLDSLLHNKAIKPQHVPAELSDIQDKFIRLSSLLQELKLFAVRLASGDVNAPTPGRENYIAAGLKQLQAQMLHLTWQAQRVAQGDYRQQIDFMGDFSRAFNEMVSQLATREDNLRAQQEVMEKIFNVIEPILVVNDDDVNEILYANEMAVLRFAVNEGVVNTLPEVLSDIFALTPGNLEHQVLDIASGKWYGVLVYTLSWGERNKARIYYCRDITAHKARENTLKTAANTDKLTGIDNRRAFDKSYARQWESCAKTHKPLSLVMFDLDHFKRFNDTYGHPEGDKVLVHFGSILRQHIGRKEDITARYGGEEFIAALPMTSQENAMALAGKICRLARQRPVVIRDQDGSAVEVTITASAGVSTIIPAADTSPALLIQAADYALYQAKAAGRDRVCFFPVSMLPQNGNEPGK